MSSRRLIVLALACAVAGLWPAAADAGYKNTVLATSPYAYYGLGETGGTMFDQVGSLHGAYSGPGRGVDGAPVYDAFPGALQLHGNGGFAVPIRQGIWGGGPVPYSVNLWVKWDGWRAPGFNENQGIFGNFNLSYSNGGWALDIPGGDSPPGAIRFMRNSSAGIVGVAAPLAQGNWTMVTATYDAAVMRLYVNGALASSLPTTGVVASGWNDTFVGFQDYNRFFSGAYGYFNGALDELTVWTRAISTSEITSIYAAKDAPPPPPPPPTRKPVVVFVPGIGGTTIDTDSGDVNLWPQMILGTTGPIPNTWLDLLSVEPDGRTPRYEVVADEILRSAFTSDAYGEFLTDMEIWANSGLIDEFLPFPYDWRLGTRGAAVELAQELRERCGNELWVVTHSTGGLVLKAALRMLRDSGLAPEDCFGSGGVFFLAVPHAGAVKALGTQINPDAFFGSLIERLVADERGLAGVLRNWLTAWELMPRRGSPHGPPSVREPWFDNPDDGLADLNVNYDELNWALDGAAEDTYEYLDDYAQTVGSLPVYNVVGIDTITPGSYAPGSCSLVNGVRRIAEIDRNVRLDGEIYGDGTVPLYSAVWPGAPVASEAHYGVPNRAHGKIPSTPAVISLIERVVMSENSLLYPEMPGLAHGRAALGSESVANEEAWRTSICSPVAVLAKYGDGEIGVRPDRSTVSTVPRALLDTAGDAEDDTHHQTLVIPDADDGKTPVYELTPVGNGPVSIWHTDTDGSEHDFHLDAQLGDKWLLRKGATEWELVIDRGGDGTTDETLVANTPSLRVGRRGGGGGPLRIGEGGSLDLDADGFSADGGSFDFEWELLEGSGTLEVDGDLATYEPFDGPEIAKIAVNARNTRGQRVRQVIEIEVPNGPPTADAGSDRDGVWGVPIAFDGSVDDAGPTDRAAGVASTWSFGDGADAPGPDAEHAYAEPGSYTATLAARDKDGATASDDAAVTIGKRQAVVHWTAPATGTFGFAALTVSVTDAVDAASARLAGLPVTIVVDGVERNATTAADGSARVQSVLPLAPGTHEVSVRLRENGLYVAQPLTASLAVVSGRGTAHGPIETETAGRTRATFTVSSDGTSVKGELNYKSAAGVEMHVHDFAAFGLAPDGRSAWIGGRHDDGRTILMHVVSGDPGSFALWLDGVQEPGAGPLVKGHIRLEAG